MPTLPKSTRAPRTPRVPRGIGALLCVLGLVMLLLRCDDSNDPNSSMDDASPVRVVFADGTSASNAFITRALPGSARIHLMMLDHEGMPAGAYDVFGSDPGEEAEVVWGSGIMRSKDPFLLYGSPALPFEMLPVVARTLRANGACGVGDVNIPDTMSRPRWSDDAPAQLVISEKAPYMTARSISTDKRSTISYIQYGVEWYRIDMEPGGRVGLPVLWLYGPPPTLVVHEAEEVFVYQLNVQTIWKDRDREAMRSSIVAMDSLVIEGHNVTLTSERRMRLRILWSDGEALAYGTVYASRAMYLGTVTNEDGEAYLDTEVGPSGLRVAYPVPCESNPFTEVGQEVSRRGIPLEWDRVTEGGAIEGGTINAMIPASVRSIKVRWQAGEALTCIRISYRDDTGTRSYTPQGYGPNRFFSRHGPRSIRRWMDGAWMDGASDRIENLALNQVMALATTQASGQAELRFPIWEELEGSVMISLLSFDGMERVEVLSEAVLDLAPDSHDGQVYEVHLSGLSSSSE